MTNPRNSEHTHVWERPNGPYVVIATNPPQYPYHCECGAFTHDPETGEPCHTCDPMDWDERTDQLVTLVGGPLNGRTVPKPLNRSVLYDYEQRGHTRFVLRYEYDETKDQWAFRWNDWAVPVVTREAPMTHPAENESESA